MSKKILLFKIGAIGDVIMTTPLIKALRKRYPNYVIDYLVGMHSQKVLENNPHINDIIGFDEKIFFDKRAFSALGLIKSIRKRNYDIIFVLDKSIYTNVFASLLGIPVRIGFDRLGKEGKLLTKKVFYDGSMHEIRYYLKLLPQKDKKKGINYLKTEIFPSINDKNTIKKIMEKHDLKRFIIIAPGGARNPGQAASSKIWPFEKFIEVIKGLKITVVLVGDKGDIQIGRIIEKKEKKQNIINLIGKTSIQQTSLLMKYADAIICNDTGALHMATTSNDRIVALFGPTDPKRFGPLSKNSVILHKKTDCCPCNDIFGSFKRCNSNECMDRISAADVNRCLKKYGIY